VLVLLLIPAWLGAAGHRALAAQAAQLVALGPEEEVYTDVFPNAPAVAAQPDGSYVIAWDDDTNSINDGSFNSFYIPPGGGPDDEYYQNVQWLVSPTGVPSVDAVTAGRDGFDVLWHTVPYEDEPTLFYRAHLNLQGVRQGRPVRMGGVGTQWVWQVRGNGFMAGWPLPGQHGIAARRLTTAGKWTGPQLNLNSLPVDHPASVSVVGLADASFVAVWLGSVPGSTRTVLRARRFSPSGKPLGSDFDVNTIPLGVLDPSSGFDPGLQVAAAPGGGFVIGWALSTQGYLRWFNASGTPLGPEVKSGFPASIAFDDAGNLLLFDTWQVQLFDPRGTPLGAPMDVNDDETEEPWGGGVAWTGHSWIVAWVAQVFPYDQGSIFVRRFAKK
jgi:hypothetical protein